MRWALLALVVVCTCGLYLAARSRPVLVATPVVPGSGERVHSIAPAPAVERAAPDHRSIAPASSLLTISGRVQSAAGVALEGAQICVGQLDVACCESLSCTLSNASGRFVLQHEAEPGAALFASHVGYLPLRRELRGLGAEPVLLTLQAGGARVAGVVVDATGGPIAGAWLSALDEQNQVLASGVSDEAGLFGLDVSPGALRVSARADGYSEQLQKVRAPALGLRIALTPASSIVGRTITEQGLAVAGVRVVALGRDGLWATPPEAESGEDGTFRLNDLAAGHYALLAVSEHWRSDERSVHVGVAEATEPIELVLHAATRLTALVQVAGAPCAEGSVSLSGAVGAYAPLAEEGRAVFDGIIPGRYRVSVECEAGLDQSDSIDLGPEPVTRTWELQPGLRISGVALTSTGTPVAGAPIEVTPVDEPFGRSRTHCTSDERGEFSCAGLEPGDYECAIGHGIPLRSDAVRVALTEASSPRIVLHAYAEAAMRVRIADAEQFDLQALPLVARGKAGAVFGQLEGDELVFEPLALGSYELVSESGSPGSGTLVELTREGEVARLTLSLPTAHTLSGRVVGDDGQAIPDAWVRAVLMSRDARVRPVTPVLTDAEGAFSLAGLLPGRYRLTVSSAQGQAQLDDVASDSRGVVVTKTVEPSPGGEVSAALRLEPRPSRPANPSESSAEQLGAGR